MWRFFYIDIGHIKSEIRNKGNMADAGRHRAQEEKKRNGIRGKRMYCKIIQSELIYS
jgi:hypothetical protein